MINMYVCLVSYHLFFNSLLSLFHRTDLVLVCTQSAAKNLVLFLAVQLNSIRVNMMGVRDNVPCKLVWDLSPNTINLTGMVGP